MTLRNRCCHAFALAFFLLSSVPDGMVVVCVREEGHVVLEIVGPPEPLVDAAAAADSAVLEATPCACGDRCGPCRDLEVRAANPPVLLTAASGQTAVSAQPAPAICTAILPPPTGADRLPGLADPGRSPSSWPELQRSVVIRA